MNFPTLADNASVRDALAINPDAGRLLSAYHQQILRGKSPLTVAERELIAAYVSALNKCKFCYRTHAVTARLFGIPQEMFDALEVGDELSTVSDKLRPMLAFARQLTLDHQSITADHAQAVFDVGWSKEALHDLILVASMFNFMNRFVHGHGIEGDDELWEDRGRYLYENGYSAIVDTVVPPGASTVPADSEHA